MKRRFYVYSEQDVQDFFSINCIAAKKKVGIDRFPLFFLEEPSVLKYANAFFQLYNDIGKNPMTTLYEQFSKTVVSLSMKENENLYSFLADFIEQMPALSNYQQTELLDLFRVFLYYPFLWMQIRKQKAVTGYHLQTQKPLFSNFFVDLPESTNQPLSAFMFYFLYPLSSISRIFTEDDQQWIPKVWIHPYQLMTLKIPEISGNWREFTQFALKNRKYALPSEGVLLHFSDAEDIQSILLKEVFIQSTIACYARVDFSNQTSDLLLFNPTLNVVFSSGYGDIVENFDNDRLLRFVAQVYQDLLTIRKHPNQGQREVRGHYTTSGHAVSGHVRRLAFGHQASSVALQNAKKYGISLPPNYTFVQPYETKN